MKINVVFVNILLSYSCRFILETSLLFDRKLLINVCALLTRFSQKVSIRYKILPILEN